MSLHVLFYESAEDVMSRVPAHYPEHHQRLVAFKARGELVMVGVFADAQRDGSMSIFRSREAAEEFVAGDPFVREGVVRSWTIKEWLESADDL